MPALPLAVTLSDGQKIDVLKRFRKKYGDEMTALDAQQTEILTALEEADFMAQYVGEQVEVKDLRGRKAELEAIEARRLHLGKLIDRLDAVIPAQSDVHAPMPNGASTTAGGRTGVRRY